MNFRGRAKPEIIGFQIAPMVDILLVLLVFFIMTWNFALKENELDVKIPSASQAKPISNYVGQVVVNIKSNGALVFNRKPITSEALLEKLTSLASLTPEQAVIIRGDKEVKYEFIVEVMDLCRKANIWNIAFATGKQE